MKIGEAQKVYSNHLNELWNKKTELLKQKKENEKKQNHEANKGVILELSGVEEQYDKAKKLMEDFMTYKTALYNAEVTKQQGEAMKDLGEDMAKCMEIARRISNGDRVPAYDEQKLLEYSYELYMAAKNAAMLNAGKSDKEHDSLWADEEDKPQQTPDAFETVDNMECGLAMPEDIGMAE